MDDELRAAMELSRADLDRMWDEGDGVPVASRPWVPRTVPVWTSLTPPRNFNPTVITWSGPTDTWWTR